MTLGREFFRKFAYHYQKYAEEHPDILAGNPTALEWTKHMFDFLSAFARSERYTIETEVPDIKGRRFDMTLRSRDGAKTIVIEHENSDVREALKSEIPKLARSRADLHVCITYISPTDYPGTQRAEECLKILESVNFPGEFLLILAPNNFYSPSDWVCHVIEKKLQRETIVHPSKIRLVPLMPRPESPKTKPRGEGQPKTEELPTEAGKLPEITRAELKALPDGEVIVCPSLVSGVSFLLKYNAWGFIYVGREPKYLALYVSAPYSSILYFGEVLRIESEKGESKFKEISEQDMENYTEGKQLIVLKPGSLRRLSEPIQRSKREDAFYFRSIAYYPLKKFTDANSIDDLRGPSKQ